MVNHARKCDIQQYISFTTRLGTLLPNTKIDESNNPLDPEQIGDCFAGAIRPLGLKTHYLLTVYREFNKTVFHHLEEVLADANQVMIGMGILPNLDIKARNRELQKPNAPSIAPLLTVKHARSLIHKLQNRPIPKKTMPKCLR